MLLLVCLLLEMVQFSHTAALAVSALEVTGVPMVPVSWQEMQCPQTKAVEKRKVAKA